jgi:ribosomal protein S18 acetylase RimI-like enzyme
MNVTIRDAHEEDIDSILNIYSQPTVDNGVVLRTDEAKEIFETINSYPSYTIYVAEVNAQVIGTIAVLIMDNIGHSGKKSAVLESIAVLPESQGKGVGKAMLKYAIEVCKNSECYKITLSANKKRVSAHKFYETLGFEQHGLSYMLSIRS